MATTPQVCSLAPFLSKVVPADSGTQLFIQQLENWLRKLKDQLCVDIQNAGGGGGVTKFTELSDAPHSYTGQVGKFVRVNGTETALEFFTLALVTAFIQLSDVPNSYTGAALQALRVKATEDGLEFFTQVLTLLADFPSSYTGQANLALRVNAGETAVEFFQQLFTLLGDVPSSYTGQAGKLVVVNSGETGLTFSTSIPAPPSFEDPRNFTYTQLTITGWFLTVATPFMAGLGISAFVIETGTGSFVLPATGNTLLSRSHARYVSAAGANSTASIRNSGNLVVRLGSASSEGGFRFCIRIGVDTTVANTRFFAGLSANVAFGNNTLTSRVDVIGFGWDAASDSNVQILHNDNAGNINKVDLGSNFPANDGLSLYDLQIIVTPNQGGFTYKVTRVNDGLTIDGTVNSQVPAGTQGLTPYVWIHNGGTAAAVAICPSHMILNNYD